MTEVTRRWVVSALLAGVALPACANAPSRSPVPPTRPTGTAAAAGRAAAAPEELIQAARLGGRVAFAVAEASSGRILEAHDPDLGQPPASVVKAVTSVYALETLGESFRFGTRLVATGPVSGGQVAGDLLLVGGGDPTLGTDGLADMAADLRARGITSVSGRFLVHGGALPSVGRIDRNQPDHVAYNPAISGLNLNFNRVQFRWRRAGGSHEVIMEAPDARHNVRVGMAEMSVANRQVPVYTYADTGASDRWTVARAALGDGGSRWLPVRHPELYAGDVFRSLARAQGITLPPPQLAPAGAVAGSTLVERSSAPLRTILSDMMRFSTNLTAEVVGLAAGQRRGGVNSLAQSGQRMTDWAVQRFGIAGARLVDHSGLGDASRLSPAQMVRLLCAQGTEANLRGLMRDHPMRDRQGNPMPNHPVQVNAKTGTLNFVSGLAGYVSKSSGPDLAFAIFTADEATRSRIAGDDRERPAGGSEWAGRSRRLQQQLIERWAAVYS